MDTLDLPRPLRSAAPLVVLAALAGATALDPRLPWLLGAIGALCFGVAAFVRAIRARVELAAVRRTADRLIIHGARALDASELVRWRCEELTSRESRDAMRREIEHVLGQLDPRTLPSASPLRRPAARANEHLLRALADRLGSSRPISARGVLFAATLLRDGGSPLYAEGSGTALLARALTRALGALEP